MGVILKWLCLGLMVGGIWLGWLAPAMAQGESAPLTEARVEQLQELADKAFEATNQGDFAAAEDYWTQIIEQFPDNPAMWSNRGNVRISQNKLKAAIADYNKAIELAPEAPDPYLNRGIALEGLERWQAAIADYNRVLDIDPEDPLAYNNRGNAEAGLGEWDKAVADYEKATELAPDFAFARANYALALYQSGKTQPAIRTMRQLVRKYPKFPDVRAALTAALWSQGKQGEAESHWVSAVGLDARYRDLDWVANVRRWPPKMVSALERFINIQSARLELTKSLILTSLAPDRR